MALTLLMDATTDALFVEAGNIAATPAYSKRARVQALQVLYTPRKQSGAQVLYPAAFWSAIRQIWSRDSGDVRYAAGELLKLQGGRSG